MRKDRPILNRYYDLEYFSSNSCTCYIGDVFVDEINHIQYQRVQEKTPLYGYASQLFDDTARGHVLVSGVFSINYKEQGYLWSVLKRWFGTQLDENMSTGNPSKDKTLAKRANVLFNSNRIGANNEGIGGKPIIGSNGTKVSRATIERLGKGQLTRQERYEFNRTLAGWATFSPGGGKDKVFEDIVEVFEDQLWTQDNQKLLEQVRRTDDNAFDGFDMYVLFGNYSIPAANHTAIKICGVRITGESLGMVADGEPVIQTFNFIARTTF